ncbi:MAG: hypothetical protein P4M04_16395 [Acidobacteriota bacterium]|nr:hypothetical protein [Acidobacteriota bacterium]
MAGGPGFNFAPLRATTFPRMKLWDFITQDGVTALAAVLVRD